MSELDLKECKILVTAGSTWVAIDTVRVITNIFKGSIGFTVAEMAASMGANVTLLISKSFDISNYQLPRNLKVVRFNFFDELDNLLQTELRDNSFDAVVHSAAVSDFRVLNEYNGKIKSDINKITLELVPTKKIVDYIKKMSPDTFLVKFKLEVGISEIELIKIANRSLRQSNADLIVANIYNPNFSDHEAHILNSNGESVKILGKKNIAYQILQKIYDRT